MNRRTLNQSFNFFIGIDQTGAVLDGGRRAKPLPIAIIDARQGRPRLLATDDRGRPLQLSSFARIPIEQLFEKLGVTEAQEILRSSSTAILADAVFGLPKVAWPPHSGSGAKTFRELFTEASSNDSQRSGYGLKPAATFFAQLLKRSCFERTPNSSPYPVRECERIANANSVFRTHPFQKNIQCGTYRFWKDLGLYGSDWIHLRYFERAKDFRTDRPILFEAYPSLMWKTMFDLRSRDRTKIREALNAFSDLDISASDVDLIESDADHADACILALGGYWLAKRNRLIDGNSSRDEQLAKEGWIAGLPRPK